MPKKKKNGRGYRDIRQSVYRCFRNLSNVFPYFLKHAEMTSEIIVFTSEVQNDLNLMFPKKIEELDGSDTAAVSDFPVTPF